MHTQATATIQEHTMSTLQTQGFRFIKRGRDFRWCHPLDAMPGDVDCTDMDDDEFAELVRSMEDAS